MDFLTEYKPLIIILVGFLSIICCLICCIRCLECLCNKPERDFHNDNDQHSDTPPIQVHYQPEDYYEKEYNLPPVNVFIPSAPSVEITITRPEGYVFDIEEEGVGI